MTLNSMDKILLAFEYGLILSEAAKELGIEVNSELSEKAEEVIKAEFETRTIEDLAKDMNVNILAILQPNTENKKATE